ncbi:MAG: super-infection exclusion protein B [Hafnia alvei]|nr:super-infection exclusion protein B [Hafnia alvei]
MYMIVIWVALLVLTPVSWPVHVESKVGIPHIWHIFIFALSFSLAINVQRLSSKLFSAYKNRKKIIDERNKLEEIRTVISGLTDEQKVELSVALCDGEKFIVTSQVFPHISELIELGVLKSKFSQWEGDYLIFPIDEAYLEQLVLRWDPENIEIKPYK